MKLIRYELENGDGVWQNENFDKLVDEYMDSDEYIELSNIEDIIYCPGSYEFKLKHRPTNGRFYFTEKGEKVCGEYMKTFSRCYDKYMDIKVRRIELDTPDLERYTVHYQDDMQVCLEVL